MSKRKCRHRERGVSMDERRPKVKGWFCALKQCECQFVSPGFCPSFDADTGWHKDDDETEPVL